MSWITTLLPIAFRALGLARYTAEAIKLLPYISTYGPIVFDWIINAKASWASFKSKHPSFAAVVEKVASRLLPNIPVDKAAEITMVGVFWPGKMRPEYEKIWQARGTFPANENNDFPQAGV